MTAEWNRSKCGVITRANNNISTLADALEVLMSLSARDHEDRSDINDAMACLLRIQRRHGTDFGSVVAQPSPEHDQFSRDGKEPFRYANMPISEATVEILKSEAGGEAMSL